MEEKKNVDKASEELNKSEVSLNTEKESLKTTDGVSENIQKEYNEPAQKAFIHKPSEDEPKNAKLEAPEKVAERPKDLPERNTKKVSALSLKSIQKKQELLKEKVAQEPDAQNLPKENFTEAAMQAAWQDYTKHVEAEGRFNLLSHMSMGVPRLEGSLIHLEFPNQTIKVEMERAKFEVLTFLRERLQNYDIDLSIEVNEVAMKKYAYTPREKFEKLKEKNPLIDVLRKEFDLDV